MKILFCVLILILMAMPVLANNSLIELSELEETPDMVTENNTSLITGSLENPFGPLSMIVLIMALIFFWIIYKDKE